MGGILDGLRVVEGSAFIAAPSGGMTLASLGADVIRFDPIGGGIDYRRWPITETGNSIYWRDLNKGKRSISVDIRSDEGRELISELIGAPGPDAGFFLTNFPARGWLAYDALVKRREDLIQVSIQGDRHGGTNLDYTVNARVGVPHINGPDGDGEHTAVHNSALPAWDLLCGQQAAIGILAAERHRTRTGKGQELKIALADIAFATVSTLGYIGEVVVNGESRARHGNRLYGAFGRDFRCADGESVMVVGISSRQWTSLLEATESEQAVAAIATKHGLDFRREGDRFKAHDEICDAMAPWFARNSFAEVASALDGRGVCWGRYQDFATMVAEDADASIDNPMFNLVEQPDVGTYPVAGSPIDFSGVDRVPATPAPRLGEHTDEILVECLGLSDGAVGALRDKGVVA